MEFNEGKAIYLQIVETICDKIVKKEWGEEERIPSVRELASSFEVNPNTVMRTYNHLQQMEIIYNKRGIGYFLSQEAYNKTIEWKKDEFIQTELPLFIQKMDALGYTITDLKELLKEVKNENKQ